MSIFLRKYATATTVYFPLIGAGTVNFTSTASLTTADMKLSINGGAFATVGTAIANLGSFGYSYTCTTADLTGKHITMVIHHTAGAQAFEDSMILIETYGNTNAAHTFDFSIANQTVIASAGTVTLSAAQVVTVGTNNDKTGYSLTQTFPSNFADLSISVTTGGVKLQPNQTVIASAGTVTLTGGQLVTVGTISAAAVGAGLLSAGAFAVGFLSAGGIAANAISAGGIATNAIDADALAADAVAEIWGQAMVEPTAVPSITASVLSALGWMYALSRGRIEQTATTQVLKQTDGATTVATATVSDDGTTFVRGSFN